MSLGDKEEDDLLDEGVGQIFDCNGGMADPLEVVDHVVVSQDGVHKIDDIFPRVLLLP